MILLGCGGGVPIGDKGSDVADSGSDVVSTSDEPTPDPPGTTEDTPANTGRPQIAQGLRTRGPRRPWTVQCCRPTPWR